MRDYTIQALKQAIQVVEALSSQEQSAFSLDALTAAADISRNTVFRTLCTLRDSAWVVDAPGGYRLGPALIRLAEDYRKLIEHRRRELDEEEKGYLGG